MKFKFSWGTLITLTYTVFLVIVLSTVVFTFGIDVNLVTEDYYEQELEYGNKIAKINRANALPEKPEISLKQNFVEFKFPDMFPPEKISGNILFFRPSDRNRDKSFKIELNSERKQFVPSDKLQIGHWKIKIDWAVNGTEYYTEKIVMLN